MPWYAQVAICVDVIKNTSETKKSVHFERRLHYVRDLFRLHRVKIFLVGTFHMMADNMTKVVDRDKFFRCRNYQMKLL